MNAAVFVSAPVLRTLVFAAAVLMNAENASVLNQKYSFGERSVLYRLRLGYMSIHLGFAHVYVGVAVVRI